MALPVTVDLTDVAVAIISALASFFIGRKRGRKEVLTGDFKPDLPKDMLK